ncbi:MAG: alpha/beta hydrolase [Candidatus Binatia bacterium]|nr:alpha/beta hydrolase [Candidatus Binatia bacterium]
MSDSIETIRVNTGEIDFEIDVAGDPKSERLALLLHGFPELNYSWRHQMPMLARLGYRVWAPNQRGYGNTTRPLGTRAYRTEALVDDVSRLIDASGCKSVTLFGHDWGAIVAWMFALARPRTLDRLVIMNVPHPTLFRRGLKTFAQMKRSWYGVFFQVPRLPEAILGAGNGRAITEAFRGMAIDKSRFPEEVTEVYRRHATQPGALTAMVNWYRGLRYMPPAWKKMVDDPPLLDVPTLLVWGEEDTALGKELTYGTDALVSDLTVRYLANVSHWVQQEAPEAVNAMVEAWVTGAEVPEYADLMPSHLGSAS